MNTYSVRYKLPGSLFFKTIKNIIEDGFVENHPIRYFITTDRQRYEVASTGVFHFDTSRSIYIEELNAKRDEQLSKISDNDEVIPGVARPND